MFLLTMILIVTFVLLIATRSRLSELEYKVRGLNLNFDAMADRLRSLEGKKVEPSAQPLKETPQPTSIKPVEEIKPEIRKEVVTPIPAFKPAPALTKAGVLPPADVENAWTIPQIDWEKFTGVKLFSWLGGFALFLGAAFFFKYSIDNGLIGPLVRVIIGFVTGTAAIVGGLWLRKKEGYEVTVQTLCAAGIAILYADVFGAHAFYHFIGLTPAFFLMVLVTLLSFLLAVRLDAKYVAILGLIGGFLTPPLLSTGVDRALGLFSYIAILDIGIMAVAYKKRWNFLLGMIWAGTLFMQWGWYDKFFTVQKIWTAETIFLLFSALFMFAHDFFERNSLADKWSLGTAALMPVSGLFLPLIVLRYEAIGVNPGILFSYAIFIGIMASVLTYRSKDYFPAYITSGLLTFAMLFMWTTKYLTTGLLFWGLSFYFLFAIVYGLMPALLKKKGSLDENQRPWAAIFPLLMLGLVVVNLVLKSALSFFIWPFVFLLCGVAIVISIMLALWWSVACAVMLFMTIAGLWISQLPDATGLGGLLIIVGLFSLMFFAVGLFIKRKYASLSLLSVKLKSDEAFGFDKQLIGLFDITSLSVLMPYMLLIIAVTQLALPNPSSIFGIALLMTILVGGLVRYHKMDLMYLVSLIGAWLVQYTWFNNQSDATHLLAGIPWNVGFFLLYSLFPFFCYRQMKERILPWITSAAAGPLYFYLIYKSALPAIGPSFIGALPLGFAFYYLVLLLRIKNLFPSEITADNTPLALFGAIALFFITLIIPIQFEKEWITVGWVLEAVALVWLYKRIPHQGLKIWSAGLFAISFVRLALNTSVLGYHARTATPIFNWYLYAYGIAAICFFLAAHNWTDRKSDWEKNISQQLNAGGTILTFLLLNIEIADFYSTGTAVTFHFSQSFAADLTYSLGWAIFAFILLVAGIKTRSKGARYASLGLLLVTAIKVFLHDLWNLGQLYRVGAFIGLAVVLMLVSYLYQRFIAKEAAHA